MAAVSARRGLAAGIARLLRALTGTQPFGCTAPGRAGDRASARTWPLAVREGATARGGSRWWALALGLLVFEWDSPAPLFLEASGYTVPDSGELLFESTDGDEEEAPWRRHRVDYRQA